MESSLQNKKILVIDDEVDLLNLLAAVLAKEGFQNVRVANSGTKGLELFKAVKPDFVILDIMLGDMEGYDVCKEIRQSSSVPILFLSAKSDEMDKLLGFALGGDDYVTKPFSPKEVAYRVKAQLKRGLFKESEKQVITFGPFEIDEEKLEVRKNKKVLELKPKELKLLIYMAKHPNQILSKERICDEVWGESYIGYDNTIMVHVRRLREKIEENPSKPKHVVNVKGLGYKLVVEGEHK